MYIGKVPFLDNVHCGRLYQTQKNNAIAYIPYVQYYSNGINLCTVHASPAGLSLTRVCGGGNTFRKDITLLHRCAVIITLHAYHSDYIYTCVFI